MSVATEAEHLVAGAMASETTDDLFLGGTLRMRQPKSGYRAGLDAVLLAAACPVQDGPGGSCLDCGAGVGVAGLAAARRVGNLSVTLIERDPTLADLAAFNITANGLEARCRVVADDVTRPLSQIGGLADVIGRFDHVLANPPYYAHGAGTRAADRLKDGSHAMVAGGFQSWARFAAAMVRDGGTFTIVHKPEALPEILMALDRRFGRVRVLPLYSRADQPASRLLVQCIKGSRAGLRLLPGRVLHAEGSHAFTPEFDAILRGGAALKV